MRLEPLPLPGAFVVERDRHEDSRGWFQRVFCERELVEHGLVGHVSQASLSFNARHGTVRGLHYQAAPHAETKVITCLRGAVWDVLVDLRPGPTRGQFAAAELTAANGLSVYVPAGFAHGFQTLADDTLLLYQISEPYRPELARGVRYDDTKLAIPWPRPVTVISDRDRALPPFDDGSVR